MAELQGQLAQRTEQAQQQERALGSLRASACGLEDLVAGRQAEAQSLAMQLEAAQEELAAAQQQVGAWF